MEWHRWGKMISDKTRGEGQADSPKTAERIMAAEAPAKSATRKSGLDTGTTGHLCSIIRTLRQGSTEKILGLGKSLCKVALD